MQTRPADRGWLEWLAREPDMNEPQGAWLRRPGDGTAIVFVHGLLSDGDGCWRSDSAYWPDLLAHEDSLAKSGIYVFSYRTAVFSGGYSIGDAVEAMNEPQGAWLRRPGDGTAIVFVHGLLSDGDGCWRSDSAYWPDLLAHEDSLAKSGIYVFSYRTAVFSGGYSIGDAVEALKAYLELDGLLTLRTLVFVCQDSTLKVTDFSLARRIAVVGGQYPFVTAGTWPYVPPEWFDGKPSDSTADLYAWGVILHEMLTGSVPFALDYSSDLHAQMKAFYESKGLQKLTSHLYYTREHAIAFPLRELISYCLQWYPGERPGSFGEILTILDRVAPAESAPATGESLTTDEELARAVSMFALGRADTAKALLNQLMVRQPGNEELWLKIAGVLEVAGDTDDATAIRERF